MQAVFFSAGEAALPTLAHLASGRDYMMRSEKRGRSSGSTPSGSSGNKPKRPPKRRRRRAGFFYKLFTMLLLLVLWPVGLLLLWRRKLRWSAGTKLLTSVVTLGACIILLGFALTVNTGNAAYTAFQDKANNYLDVAADALVDFSDVAIEKAGVVYDGATNLADALWTAVRGDVADGVEQAAHLGGEARAWIEGFIEGLTSDKETDAPDAEVTPAPEDAAATSAPDIQPDQQGASLTEGILSREGDILEATMPPLQTAEPTPEPTPEVLEFAVKSAANAIVYYNQGSGKCYHMAPACGSMKTADEHLFGDTLGSTVRQCSICGTPDKAILDEKYIVWTDGSNTAHLSDECGAFTGDWNIIPAAQAKSQSLSACAICGADRYIDAVAAGKDVILAEYLSPTPAPTEKPTKAPTAVPTKEPTKAPTTVPTVKPISTSSDTSSHAAADAAKLPDVAILSVSAPVAEATAEPTIKATIEATAELTTKATIEATAEPTATATVTPAPTEPPAPTRTPMPMTPTRPLKATGEAQVYLADGMIHASEACSAIAGSVKAVTLAECAGCASCQLCAAPEASLAKEHCLWLDSQNLCHTSNACEAFAAPYSLVLRDEALLAGLSGCPACKATEYLFPNTSINYDAIPSDT